MSQTSLNVISTVHRGQLSSVATANNSPKLRAANTTYKVEATCKTWHKKCLNLIVHNTLLSNNQNHASQQHGQLSALPIEAVCTIRHRGKCIQAVIHCLLSIYRSAMHTWYRLAQIKTTSIFSSIEELVPYLMGRSVRRQLQKIHACCGSGKSVWCMRV